MNEKEQKELENQEKQKELEISLRNGLIMNRLMFNFKTLHGITINRVLRLKLIEQIESNRAFYYYRNDETGIQISKVLIYNNITHKYKFFDVIYDNKIKQILDVFPPQANSIKMNDFLEDIHMIYNINKDEIINRKKSFREIKDEEFIKKKNYIKSVILGKKRLNKYLLTIKNRKLLVDLIQYQEDMVA